MRRTSVLSWLPALVVVATVTVAGLARAEDPDGGVARAYFQGIEIDPAPSPEIRPGIPHNMVWIVVDAMRPDHLGAYGYPHPTSDFMDQLAKESRVFLHHYVNAPWTRSSTASMLTGLYPSEHRTQTEESRLPKGLRTIAQDLRKLGYQTAGVCGNGNASSIAGLDRGFDVYRDSKNAFRQLPDSNDVYREALTFVDAARKQKQPFFLFIFVVDPHDPYRAPKGYEKKWLKRIGFEGEPRRTAHWEYDNDYPKRERDSMIAVYDAAIDSADDAMRRFVTELKGWGLWDDMTFLVTADHGDGFGEHGYYLHAHHHYDEIVHVPLILKTPMWPGTGQVFHLTQAVDLLPTLVTLAGGTPREGLAGRDIGAMLRQPVDRDREGICEYNAFGIHRSSIFSLRHRVILQTPAEEEVFRKHIPKKKFLPSVNFEHEVHHVYDRAKDPLDRDNLAPDRVPPPAKEMLDRLRTHMLTAAAPNRDVVPARLSPHIVESLRSMGYLQ